jgi:hypothetical protein
MWLFCPKSCPPFSQWKRFFAEAVQITVQQFFPRSKAGQKFFSLGAEYYYKATQLTLTKNLTMAKNQPPSNAHNATIDMAEGHAIERAPLHDVNGHHVSVADSKAAYRRKLEVLLADKCKRSKSALKDLALAKSKGKKLLDLLDNIVLTVVQLRTGKTGSVMEVSLLEKLHKTELKFVK